MLLSSKCFLCGLETGWVYWKERAAFCIIAYWLWSAACSLWFPLGLPLPDENIAQCAIARRFEEQNGETPPSLVRSTWLLLPRQNFNIRRNIMQCVPRALWICMRVWQIKERHRWRWTSKMNSLCSFLFAFKTHSHTLLDLDWANTAEGTYAPHTLKWVTRESEG